MMTENLANIEPFETAEADSESCIETTTSVSVDLSPADFLKKMHPEGPWCITAINPEKSGRRTDTRTFYPGEENGLKTFIAKHNGKWNLYFSVNPVKRRMNRKATRADVQAMTWLHVDVDPRNDKDLAEEQERIRQMFLTENLPETVPEPTMVIFSGGGYQAFWKLAVPIEIEGNLEKAEEAAGYNLQLERLFKADSCHNIDRIMRLAGTINVPNAKKKKAGRTAVQSKVVSTNWDNIYATELFMPADKTRATEGGMAVSKSPSIKVEVPSNIERLNDVHDLDQYTSDGQPLEDHVKRIIQLGHDPEDDQGKPADDRSLWVFDATCALVRRGIPDDIIFAVLTDRDFRISDHIYDQKNPDKYTVRQIQRAKEKRESAEAEFICSKEGKPLRSNQQNVRTALVKLGVKVKRDAFRNRMLVDGLTEATEYLDDRLMTNLRLRIDEEFKFLVPKEFFYDVVGDIAFRNAYHPVRDYLDGLKWDGEERLDNWLVNYCGAEDSEYVRAVGRIVLTAAVKRVREPGVKFDEMLVLEGSQGIGKSQVLQALAAKEEWFTDEVPLAGDGKLVIEAMNGRWIAEAAELKGMRNKEVEHLKAFLSRTHDRGRLAYDRITSEVPRQFIIVGTTNSEHYLMDATGNRRFWPLRVARVDLNGLKRDRNQLWAEAAHRESKGESIRLPEELWAAAGEEQGKRALEDPYLSILAEALEGRWGKLSVEDVFRIVGIDKGQRNQHHNARIGEVMRRLGWRRERLRRNGTHQYCYLNCKTQDAPWLTVFENKGQLFIDRGETPEQVPEFPF